MQITKEILESLVKEELEHSLEEKRKRSRKRTKKRKKSKSPVAGGRTKLAARPKTGIPNGRRGISKKNARTKSAIGGRKNQNDKMMSNYL